MPASNAKYKVIYGRFLLVLAAFLVGYTFLHWWWVRMHRAWLGLPITHWLLPTLIAIVLYAVCLYKRFHLLKMETKLKAGQYHKRKAERMYDNADFSIVVIPLLAGPVIAAQYLLIDVLQSELPETYPMTLHITWICTVACCLIILLVIAYSSDNRDAWQQFEADKANRKRNPLTK
ncbi:hypothetical protein [Paraflavitalea pollutisoli]|uniref:hypothetical protein n=1 Tax=Paraflavitalea pollutisoli TaxID=3034143 RepID=UPI0023ED767F|nr:hypothetical protein [Paraflavitalea sp. H1-2-19X]